MILIIKEIVSGTASAAIFLGLYIFGMPWWMSLALAGCGYFSIRFLFPSEHRKIQVILPKGINKGEFDDFMDRCRQNLSMVKDSSASITNPTFRDSVYSLCNLSDELITTFENDPADMLVARVFPDRLARLHNMLVTYIDLAGKKNQSPQTIRALKTTEDAVGKAVHKFKELHLRLLENDAIDLSTNAKTFDNLLDLD